MLILGSLGPARMAEGRWGLDSLQNNYLGDSSLDLHMEKGLGVGRVRTHSRVTAGGCQHLPAPSLALGKMGGGCGGWLC